MLLLQQVKLHFFFLTAGALLCGDGEQKDYNLGTLPWFIPRWHSVIHHECKCQHGEKRQTQQLPNSLSFSSTPSCQMELLLVLCLSQQSFPSLLVLPLLPTLQFIIHVSDVISSGKPSLTPSNPARGLCWTPPQHLRAVESQELLRIPSPLASPPPPGRHWRMTLSFLTRLTPNLFKLSL